MLNEQLEIDGNLLAEWEQKHRTDAFAAAEFYFRNILPAVVAHHQQNSGITLPCELLVSLMGLSPETTVLATTFVRPRRLQILASQNSSRYCTQCIDFLVQHELLTRESIGVCIIDPIDHQKLYAVLLDELGRTSGSRLVDLTGGKKIMSAVAGHAAWSLGLPVCYLESRAYNEQTRRPKPGSEELMILNPPKRISG